MSSALLPLSTQLDLQANRLLLIPWWLFYSLLLISLFLLPIPLILQTGVCLLLLVLFIYTARLHIWRNHPDAIIHISYDDECWQLIDNQQQQQSVFLHPASVLTASVLLLVFKTSRFKTQSVIVWRTHYNQRQYDRFYTYLKTSQLMMQAE